MSKHVRQILLAPVWSNFRKNQKEPRSWKQGFKVTPTARKVYE